MDKKTLQQEVLELLKTSSLSEHDQRITRILVPVMDLTQLLNVHTTLTTEKKKLADIDKKKKLLTLKYQMLTGKMTDMQLAKKAEKVKKYNK